MAQYYLMSQLPSLDGIGEATPLPITEERFLELCNRFLGKKSAADLQRLTLSPPRKVKTPSSPLLTAWYEGERNLRLALGKIRAEKLKKPFDSENATVPAELLRLAHKAVGLSDPLEAEKFLNSYRLDFLETLRPMDTFAEDSVFYYGLKLKLISRMRQFDSEKGEKAYKNIYSTIINKDKQEATQ